MLMIHKDIYLHIMESEEAQARFARDREKIDELKNNFELIKSFVCLKGITL
jgi:hypothetical protein